MTPRMRWLRFTGSFALLGTLVVCNTGAQLRDKKVDDLTPVKALMEQGQLDEAKAALLEELEQNPPTVEEYNLLGIIENEEKDYSEALTAFQKALKLAPNSTKTHNNLGNVYLSQKEFELAEKEFQTTLRIEPANRDGNYNLALLLMAEGQPAKAIPHLERIHPRDTEVQFNLIRAYLETRRTAEALQIAKQLSAQRNKDVRLHFSLGVLLASEKQYKLAELEFEKADILKPGTFEILYGLGQAYLLDGVYPRADLELKQAVALKPDSADALYLLGQTYWNEGRSLDALETLVHAHTIAPKNTDIILLLAQVSMADGYFEDAIPLLEKGVQIAPQRADLRIALGESYLRSDNAEKAIRAFEQAIAIQPSLRAYAFLGLSNATLGRFDQAKQDFRNGLKLEPGNSFCLYSLGHIAERQGATSTAATLYEKVLQTDPDFPDALLQLATLRIQDKRYSEAEELLRRYIRVAKTPATGYYKLAMVERELHQTDAASHDLATFQTLSRNSAPSVYAYEDLFDYLDNRSKLSRREQTQQDIAELNAQLKIHPDQPEILYLLAQANLNAGQFDQAISAITQLDKVKSNDYRTLAGAGVLLARYHLYDTAIQQFQAALQANPGSDDVKFDLANAYFRKTLYSQALNEAQQVSDQGQKDDSYLALLADIYAHLGDTAHAEAMYRSAISRNPDNDQAYLSLALLQLRQDDIEDAKQTLLKGQARVPASGKILWGLGITSVMEGDTAAAGQQFEHAVDLLPEWPASYSMLGIFYFQTGQVAKAKEVLERFKNSNARGSLNVERIEQALDSASAPVPETSVPMTLQTREGLLQMALILADRTL